MSKGKYDEHLISQVRSRIPSKAKTVSEFHDTIKATSALIEKSFKLAKEEANRMLDKYGEDKLDFRTWAYENKFSCCVTYDGGSHPEYDFNAFSYVLGFGRDSHGELYLIISDSEEYGIDHCDQYEFAWFVDQFVDHFDDFVKWKEAGNEDLTRPINTDEDED